MRVPCGVCMLLLAFAPASAASKSRTLAQARGVTAIIRQAAHQPARAALQTLIRAEVKASEPRAPALMRQVLAAEYSLAQSLYAHGDYPGCLSVLQHAVPVMRKGQPLFHDLPDAEVLLGDTALQEKDIPAALEDYSEALAAQIATAPGSTAESETLIRLGNLAFRQADVAAAHQDYSRALSVAHKAAPRSATEARAVDGLARLEAYRHHFEVSGRLFKEEYDIWKRLPGHQPELLNAARMYYQVTGAVTP